MNISAEYDVIIAGGGPAGASAAILLASQGARVLLVEQKKFPRPKLCGEFISPECLPLFERLGIATAINEARPASLTETVFYSSSGRRVGVPSTWFGTGANALGLSRAEMDELLLRRAAVAGAEVCEEASVAGMIISGDGRATGVKFKSAAGAHRSSLAQFRNDEATGNLSLQSDELVARAPVIIDATGRARILARRAGPTNGKRVKRREIVAFKAHFENTQVAAGACEIYFYRRGYGGLSTVENGLSNLCFIASARDVRACDTDADRVLREVVGLNQRAQLALQNARRCSPWLAVSLEDFGRHLVAPSPGLLTIGDAASFIDPFTGSGILMALQSGELAAKCILKFLHREPNFGTLDELARSYREAYRAMFDSRLRICSLMRRAAFAPSFANVAILLFGWSEGLRKRLTWATRGARHETYSLANRVR